jgi:hypothetical protein
MFGRNLHLCFASESPAIGARTALRDLSLDRSQWHESELVIETRIELAGGAADFRDHWPLSSDEQTLVMEHREDGLARQIRVLRRVAAR